MDNCTTIKDHCLSCNGQGYWKGHSNEKFPQDPTQYKQLLQQKIGGINNSKNFRTYASGFTILKKSLTTFNPIAAVPPKETLGQGVQTGTPSTSYTNVGGPGDQTASVPIITHSASGNKARLIVMPNQTGVDVKHNSYERYLARKRGANMRCQNC
tara:strand:+ start:884 stop:1348 length:465 start_codon:yes stop_codon:yes gene_type:complete